MVEGILVLVGITSYVSIAQICSLENHGSEYSRRTLFIFFLFFGWAVYPYRVVYKFWECLLGLPEQIKRTEQKKK
jgi:hypothetical protein